MRTSENDRLLESERERVWPVKYLPAARGLAQHPLSHAGKLWKQHTNSPSVERERETET